MAAKTYTFSSSDEGKTFKRKLHGFEAFLFGRTDGDGLFFYTGSVVAQFATPLDRASLQPLVQAAWTRLRHLAPSVALAIRRLEGGDWEATYSTPTNPSELDAWVAETTVWHDEERSAEEHDRQLGDYWWKLADGAPVCRLHVSLISAPAGQWLFSIQGPHMAVDGRMVMQLHEELLHAINLAILDPSTLSVSDLEWGKETVRLAGAGATLTPDGEFDTVIAGLKAKPPAGPPAPPPGFIPFFPTPAENTEGKTDVLSRLLTLSAAQTAALRIACKTRGRTVTQVVSSLFALADTEAAVLQARARGADAYAAAVQTYETATHWVCPLSMKDQRPYFPRHSRLHGRHGTVHFATDSCDMMLSMDRIRAVGGFGAANGTFAHNIGSEFWDGLVAHYAETHQTKDFTAAGYITREHLRTLGAANFSAEPMRVRAFVSSSVGDVDALGILSDFRPAQAAAARRAVSVAGIWHRTRSTLPLMLVVWWQFDGQLSFCWHTGARYQTEAEFAGMLAAFQRWVDALTSSVKLKAP